MTTDAALIAAESHLATYDYAGNRPTLLLYFLQMLTAAAAQSPKASAVRDWINAIVFTAAVDPDNLATFLTPPPHTFAEVVVEAAQTLLPVP
jgi:hypothetical protein